MGLRRPNLDIAPMGVSPIAQFSTMGCGQAVKAQKLDIIDKCSYNNGKEAYRICGKH